MPRVGSGHFRDCRDHGDGAAFVQTVVQLDSLFSLRRCYCPPVRPCLSQGILGPFERHRFHGCSHTHGGGDPNHVDQYPGNTLQGTHLVQDRLVLSGSSSPYSRELLSLLG
ncbi:hypothetical protein K457DRAFT_534054 [Linnemannia elongata AG-77]|uniref:Uncharacterized protein n=1 Tax=Linnemannia elongata AG-77 TaxID=1314771 RepID=A0A197JUW5_9FUNG|nr:hypothetical protein K457DRAFT_534054 [Linnemannia elongata AG-77]